MLSRLFLHQTTDSHVGVRRQYLAMCHEVSVRISLVACFINLIYIKHCLFVCIQSLRLYVTNLCYYVNNLFEVKLVNVISFKFIEGCKYG